METRWGFVIRTHPFRRLPTTSFCPLGKYTSFILVSNSSRVLRQRWVIPLPPLQNPAFTNPGSSFSHIQTVFIRFSSLESFGNCRLVNVVFLWTSKNAACHAHAWQWILWEGHPSLPFSYGALTPGEGPLFQNKHSFYTPSPMSWKRRAMLPSSLFFYGAFSLNVFPFHLGRHYPSVNLVHILVITSNVISTPSWCQIPRGIVNLFVLLLNL